MYKSEPPFDIFEEQSSIAFSEQDLYHIHYAQLDQLSPREHIMQKSNDFLNEPSQTPLDPPIYTVFGSPEAYASIQCPQTMVAELYAPNVHANSNFSSLVAYENFHSTFHELTRAQAPMNENNQYQAPFPATMDMNAMNPPASSPARYLGELHPGGFEDPTHPIEFSSNAVLFVSDSTSEERLIPRTRKPKTPRSDDLETRLHDVRIWLGSVNLSREQLYVAHSIIRSSWWQNNEQEPVLQENDDLVLRKLVNPGFSRFMIFLDVTNGYKCAFLHDGKPCDHVKDGKSRPMRALGTINGFFKYKPVTCGGSCGFESCQQRFVSPEQRGRHICKKKSNRISCDYCGQRMLLCNLKRHVRSACHRNDSSGRYGSESP